MLLNPESTRSNTASKFPPKNIHRVIRTRHHATKLLDPLVTRLYKSYIHNTRQKEERLSVIELVRDIKQMYFIDSK